MSTEQKGSLTIAGSGIAAIAHITLETLSHIREADKVYYVVADRATEAFIQDNSTNGAVDLSIFYDKEKDRYNTYVQMCEIMLRDVRAGYNVLGIFYGHPGVFVSPSHRAITIARDEGFRAVMLAGVSAEDYMFADLGFDPAVPGCMTQEATTILVDNKKLDPSVHNVIWQVGGIGVPNMVFDNRRFHLLVDRLEEDFGADHKVVHYIGAVLPQSDTVKEEFLIGDLRKEEHLTRFTTASTFYVPPRDVNAAPNRSEMIKMLGLPEGMGHITERYPYATQLGGAAVPAYGPLEQAAVARLANHTAPQDHVLLRASPALRRFMTDLALQPSLREQYKADPAAVVEAVPELSEDEKAALATGEAGPVLSLMSGTSGPGQTQLMFLLVLTNLTA
ncbi:tetrapyrrole methylase [Phanerochaete sordida]|uniref:Tetrapyrrole methylase n=1 Tax=Phanerochaete sordida TaxID=48140 RepID=A0A9P3G581_9APHY|nr:tetrapyrrole methylase [Phanerochaete sordida]